MEDFENDYKTVSQLRQKGLPNQFTKSAKGAGVGSGGVWVRYLTSFD